VQIIVGCRARPGSDHDEQRRVPDQDERRLRYPYREAQAAQDAADRTRETRTALAAKQQELDNAGGLFAGKRRKALGEEIAELRLTYARAGRPSRPSWRRESRRRT